MKKLLIFHHYNSSMGAGLSLLHIVKSICKAKKQIVVCIPKIDGDLDKKLISMGIKVIYSDAVIPYMHFSGNHTLALSYAHFKNCFQIIKSKKQIREVIQNVNPDIVAVNSMCLFWIGNIAQECNKKTICFHRETYRHGLLGVRTTYMKTRISRDFNVVAFLSYYDMKQTPRGKAKFFRVTDKVEVEKYNSLEKEQCREKEGLPKEAKLILYTGGMAQLKGPVVLVKAMNSMKTPNIKLIFLQYESRKPEGIAQIIKYWAKVLTGKNLPHKIEKYIEKHNLKDKILFKPSTDHVETYFVACDAVVFPCRDAHQARPIYEAGIAQKPIIITDFPNYREFVDEASGWLFPKDDAEKLSECLDAAISDCSGERIRKNYEKSLLTNNLTTMPKELDEIFSMLEDMES